VRGSAIDLEEADCLSLLHAWRLERLSVVHEWRLLSLCESPGPVPPLMEVGGLGGLYCVMCRLEADDSVHSLCCSRPCNNM
jgi:hypothetical protein